MDYSNGGSCGFQDLHGIVGDALFAADSARPLCSRLRSSWQAWAGAPCTNGEFPCASRSGCVFDLLDDPDLYSCEPFVKAGNLREGCS
jgi:hypothetical protein